MYRAPRRRWEKSQAARKDLIAEDSNDVMSFEDEIYAEDYEPTDSLWILAFSWRSLAAWKIISLQMLSMDLWLYEIPSKDFEQVD